MVYLDAANGTRNVTVEQKIRCRPEWLGRLISMNECSCKLPKCLNYCFSVLASANESIDTNKNEALAMDVLSFHWLNFYLQKWKYYMSPRHVPLPAEST